MAPPRLGACLSRFTMPASAAAPMPAAPAFAMLRRGFIVGRRDFARAGYDGHNRLFSMVMGGPRRDANLAL